MTVLLVAAEPREFAGLLPRLERREKLRWPVDWARRAEGPGGKFVLVANGAGPARAAAATDAALEREPAGAVVSFGYCGALAPTLEVGDIFAATAVEAAGRRFTATLPRAGRPFARGTLVSIARVAQTLADKAILRAGGADAVEMEAAGVAERVFQARLPFYCVRSITDLSDESFALDLNAALRTDGHFDTMFCLRHLLTRPAAVAPEMLRLWKRSRIAALKLGEFIADCRF